MRFDWYQASLPGTRPEVLMEAIEKAEYYGDWVQTRAPKNYAEGYQFVVGDQVKFSMACGGQNEEFGPNIKATGGDAPKLAEVLKQGFPQHRVSRLDSCEDYHSEHAYEYLRGVGLRIAKEYRVAVREITKPLPESDDGCTLYLGSEESAISGRIYQKGKQLAMSPNWVRAELQVRPQKKVKGVVASLDAEQVWGLGKWSRALAIELGKTNIQRVEVQIYQPSDDERAMRALLKQYGKMLRRAKEVHGSWETLGAQIGYDLEHMDQEMVKARLRPVKKA